MCLVIFKYFTYLALVYSLDVAQPIDVDCKDSGIDNWCCNCAVEPLFCFCGGLDEDDVEDVLILLLLLLEVNDAEEFW